MATKRRRRVSRREFIGTGVAGTTALVGAPWVAGSPTNRAEISSIKTQSLVAAVGDSA